AWRSGSWRSESSRAHSPTRARARRRAGCPFAVTSASSIAQGPEVRRQALPISLAPVPKVAAIDAARLHHRRRQIPRVAAGGSLPQVAVGVLPVEVLAAQPRVDLHIVVAARVAPVRDPASLDAIEDRVELGVAHREAVVVALERAVIGKIEGERLV